MEEEQIEWETQQADLAAQEAARIGGDTGVQVSDPARQAPEESGEGEAEGWEQAEQQLVAHASHADDRSDTIILEEAARPEAEADRATADYGQADGLPHKD